MELPATLLLTYQAEYERDPNLTIAELCEKYDVQTKQLNGYMKWTKRDIKEPPIGTKPSILATPNLPKPSELPKAVNKEKLLEDIDMFKQLAVAHAIKFMKEDAEFAEVKEFKDMVATVDSIEKSYKDTKDPQGTTINIAIQNLVEKFSDDC